MPEVLRKPSDEPDRRSQGRQKMILRVGLLEQAGKPSFCLVSNISSTGLQVKLYSSAARVGDVRVRVADENPIPNRLDQKRQCGNQLRGKRRPCDSPAVAAETRAGPTPLDAARKGDLLRCNAGRWSDARSGASRHIEHGGEGNHLALTGNWSAGRHRAPGPTRVEGSRAVDRVFRVRSRLRNSHPDAGHLRVDRRTHRGLRISRRKTSSGSFPPNAGIRTVRQQHP